MPACRNNRCNQRQNELAHREQRFFFLFMVWRIQIMRRMMWVHPLNELRLDKGEFYTLYPDLRHFVPKFFNMYRMSVPKFDRLLQKISPLIEKKWTNMREPLSAEDKLVLILR